MWRSGLCGSGLLVVGGDEEEAVDVVFLAVLKQKKEEVERSVFMVGRVGEKERR